MTQRSGWAFLTDHWRLKLLAGLLAVILFGTVAFAQNPITVRTLTVPIDQYQGIESGLVLLRPPHTIDVQVVGLSDAITPLTPNDITAAMDLSKVRVPTAPEKVQVNVNVRTVAPGVTFQQSSIPRLVDVDYMASASLPIQVLDQPVPGVSIDRVTVYRASTTEPVSDVAVTGPESELDGLKAVVNLGAIVGQADFPGQLVTFQNAAGNKLRWPPPTIPLGSLDVPNVDVVVAAHQSLQQKVVPLLAPVTGTPACGYEAAGITWSPSEFVTLTGDAVTLEANSSISVNAIDLTGATANVVSHQPIPLPTNASSVTPKSVTITVQIKQAFACTPASPSATPTPTPAPSPT